MISSHVKISMTSVISSLSLKLYLNSWVYDRNIFRSSLKVFSISLKNVQERSSGLRNNFGKSSEIFGKWSEIFAKSSKTPSVCLYNKTWHVSSKIWILRSRAKNVRELKQRRRRGRRLVKSEFIFYQRNLRFSRSVRFANGSKIVPKLNMQRRRSIPNGNTNN